MNGWSQVAIIIGMFLLRIGVPLGITLLVGYLLHRLDAKWQAEAAAHQEVIQPEPVVTLELLNRLSQPCWLIKGCDEATQARCPAARQPQLPCWLARYSADGRLPDDCYNCERFLYTRRLKAVNPA